METTAPIAGRRLRRGPLNEARSYTRREPAAEKSIRHVGLDVHAETIAVAVAEPDGEVRFLETGLSSILCKVNGLPDHLGTRPSNTIAKALNTVSAGKRKHSVVGFVLKRKASSVLKLMGVAPAFA